MLALIWCTGGVLPASGQQDQPEQVPERGLVWHPPDDTDEALLQLRRFDEAGVESLRTGILSRDTLFALADSLGLAFYQDLPSHYWNARAFQDSLHILEQPLDAMMAYAEQFESGRHIGLTTRSHTSTPEACEPLGHLAQRVREAGPETIRLYYVTRFVTANPCADIVDLVLLDVRASDDPNAVLQRAAQQDDLAGVEPGIGALGTWADPGARAGLAVPNSREQQARYLEDHLTTFFGDDAPPDAIAPPAVFVYKWSSDAEGRNGYVPGQNRPRSYSMYEDGVTHPAWDVVQGVFTGEQMVFAFPAGEHRNLAIPWLVIIAWATVAMVAGFYAGAPRFRRLVRRYFGSRGFYREAVREGRSALLGPSVLIMIAASVSLGVITASLLNAVQPTDLFELLLARLPAGAGEQLAYGVAQPWSIVLLISGAYAIGLLLWAVLLTILSRRKFALGIDQVLLLVTWPVWPSVILMLTAVAATGLPAEQSVLYLGVVFSAWLLVSIYALGRAVIDFTHLARVGWSLSLSSLLVSPIFLIILIGGFLLLEHRFDVLFAWHLMTRS